MPTIAGLAAAGAVGATAGLIVGGTFLAGVYYGSTHTAPPSGTTKPTTSQQTSQGGRGN